MTGPVILAAVDDSASAFAALEVAADLAHRLAGRLHAVMVTAPLAEQHAAQLAVAAVMRRAASAAERAGVELSTGNPRGAIARRLLDEAREVGADFIVMAGADESGGSIPTLGSHTLRVLEFADVPVLVVPAAVRG